MTPKSAAVWSSVLLTWALASLATWSLFMVALDAFFPAGHHVSNWAYLFGPLSLMVDTYRLPARFVRKILL